MSETELLLTFSIFPPPPPPVFQAISSAARYASCLLHRQVIKLETKVGITW